MAWMFKAQVWVSAALACLLMAETASADGIVRARHGRQVHHRHHVRIRRVVHAYRRSYGDVIVTHGSGMHRSDFGMMVPDSTGPNFIASGRKSRSGVGGASGIPVALP